jgi:hypothetical protein
VAGVIFLALRTERVIGFAGKALTENEHLFLALDLHNKQRFEPSAEQRHAPSTHHLQSCDHASFFGRVVTPLALSSGCEHPKHIQ